MFATLARRIAEKALVRGLCVAVGLGSTEVPLIDLRGKLPTTGEYPARDMAKVTAIVVHHSATKGQTIRSIAEFHATRKGWPAIAYHFAIGYDGKVYLLNNVDRRTNHAQGVNSRTIGVCLIGNYQEQPVPPEVVKAWVHLRAYIDATYGQKAVLWHRDTKVTLCPGDYAIEALTPYRDAY